jgi:hypothetical protein
VDPVAEAIETFIDNSVTSDNYDIEEASRWWATEIAGLLDNLGYLREDI